MAQRFHTPHVTMGSRAGASSCYRECITERTTNFPFLKECENMLEGPLVFVDVDTQRDFLEPTGALYVPGSTEILANLGA